MSFDPLHAASWDQWLTTELGRYIFSRQEKLILDLIAPLVGESLLDVGCGAGNYLRVFQQKKCLLTGIDSSAEALELAAVKLGHNSELVKGAATDLPFSDNEFDIVTIINGSQTFNDLPKVIAEAVRVSRSRVFVGFFNTNSFVGTKQSIQKLFGYPITSAMRFFTIPEIKSVIGKTIDNSSATWGSVVYLPAPVYTFFSELEELFPLKNNPLGAFVGIVFPLKYTYRTAENPILSSFDLKSKAQAAAPEAIREMLREANR